LEGKTRSSAVTERARRFVSLRNHSKSFEMTLLSSDVNKTKFLRPRPEQQDQDQSSQDQDQDRALVQCTYCSSSKQFPFSEKTAVLNILKVWRYNFNHQYNGTACICTTHFAMHKNSQSQL